MVTKIKNHYNKLDAFGKQKVRIECVAFVLYLIAYTYLILSSKNNEWNSLILVLSSTISLCSYLVLLTSPVKALLMQLASNAIVIIYGMTTGATFGDVMSDTFGMGGLLICVMTLVMMITADKKLYTDKKVKMPIKDRLLSLVNYERKPYNTRLWTKIIIYSILIVVLCEVGNSEMILTEMNNGSPVFRLYAAIAVLLPTFIIMAFITTSTLAYEFLLIQVVVETFTIIMLIVTFGIAGIRFDSIISVYIEFHVYLICRRKITKEHMIDKNKELKNE